MVRLGWKAGRSRSVAQTASTAPTRNIPTATRTLTAVSCEGVVEVRRGTPASGLRVAAQEGRWEHEDWRVRKDGTRFWADVVITALYDDDGTLVGFAKVTRDLSERKRAEEERLRLVERERATWSTPGVWTRRRRAWTC